MTLSIIIPTWNCEEYLHEMLDSILANKYSDWECFLIDDNSTDKTYEIINEYCKKDSRFHGKVRDRLPKGAQTCRNIGLNLSKDSKYIIWFDADDLISDYCLEQRVSYMESHKDLDFAIFPAITFMNESTFSHNHTALSNKEVYSYGIRYTDDSLRDILNGCLPMVGWTNIYRTDSVKKYNVNWDESVLSMQDADFNITNLAKGMRYNYAWDDGANVDYFYRSGQANNLAKKILTIEHLDSHIYLLNKTFKMLSSRFGKHYKKEMDNMTFRFAQMFRSNITALKRLQHTEDSKSDFVLWYRLLIYRLLHTCYRFNWRRTQIETLLLMSHVQRNADRLYQSWTDFMYQNNIKIIERYNRLKKSL